ncbi:hypothetical protein MMC24_004799 [Lignoscripta atroalba]|nr:hypothetical protein [Lignoscripta atroalba]
MSSPSILKIGYRPQILALLHPSILFKELTRWTSQRQVTKASHEQLHSTGHCHMDNIFINALVRASSCSSHTQPAQYQISVTPSPYLHHRNRRRFVEIAVTKSRAFHDPFANRAGAVTASPEISQDDYKHMVDYYRDSFHIQPPESQDQPVLGLPLVDRDKADSASEEPFTQIREAHNDEEGVVIERLVRVLADESSTNEAIYANYRALPFPGVSFLSEDIRQRLFHRLAVVEKRTERTMLRYLSVIDDMKAADLPISLWQWNSALAFAGRCFAIVTAGEVEAALRIWKEMEQEADVQGNNVTFNILFDIATKAGKFVLAKMILKEMEARKLSVNRFARVGMIYYFGLQGDGNGVRRAYSELVEARHIVDTVVMNCVIASLIQAGEPSAAEQVYERMKNMHAKQTGARLPSRDWKGSRELGRVLDRVANSFKNDPEKWKRVQDDQSLAPDIHTYVIFIKYHVSQTGELQRVAALLNEMQFLGLPLHGRLFLELFRGFANHGGIRYTSWTKARLESVWDSFQQAIDQEVQDVYVAKWIVIWALRAFGKCSGKDRTLEIWEELKSRWKPDQREREIVYGILGKVVGGSQDHS